MPEQITKYPDVTLNVLKGAGALCGEGAPQKILKQCPAARFCALPGGEICVYGVAEIPHMTQIEMSEIAEVIAPDNAPGGQTDVFAVLTSWWLGGVILGVGVVVGFMLGRYSKKRR